MAVDVNASIRPDGDTFWCDIEKIVEEREKIADALIEVCIGKGLTVSTAKDVLSRATMRIDQAVNGCPVGLLCIRPFSPTDIRKL